MEPHNSGPSGGYERPQGLNDPAPEHVGYGSEVLPDNAVERRPEAQPAQTEQLAPPPVIPVLPTPVVAQDDAVVTPVVSDDSGAPLSAGDDDLIEKEWVDKAKKILQETKDDPYRREQEVSKLQIEYIRKRYGREIGEAGS